MAFKLDLLTPEGVIVKDFNCDDVVLKTVRGEVNILPEHTHFLCNLGTGILTIKSEGKTRYFSVTHGVGKVLGNKISILSMTSEAAEKIDIERAKKALERADRKLKEAEKMSNIDVIKHQRKLERAEIRMKLGYLRDK